MARLHKEGWTYQMGLLPRVVDVIVNLASRDHSHRADSQICAIESMQKPSSRWWCQRIFQKVGQKRRRGVRDVILIYVLA